MRHVLGATLPRKNDFGPLAADELLAEARLFGVDTRGKFRALMLRHRRALIEADREPLDALNARIYRSEMGDAYFCDLIRRQRWFAWPALVRLALEFEFGDAYRRFAEQRDGMPERANPA